VHVSTPSDEQSPRPTAGERAPPAGEPDRARARRGRAFTPEYKVTMVAEYDNAPNGQKGVIPRREGLHSSHIIE
jgi:transposase